MIRLIAVAFALAVATSAQAMSPAPLQQPDGMITQVREACGAGFHMVNGTCVRTAARRNGQYIVRGHFGADLRWVYRVSVSDGAASLVLPTSGPSFPEWRPDGRAIFFVKSGEPNHLEEFEPETGFRKTIVDRVGGYSLSHDGFRFAFKRNESDGVHIYLAPTGEEFIGFAIYRFLQTDAVLQGGEGTIDLHPKALKKFDATVSYALLDANKGDGTPLPFIPANRLSAELKFSPTQHLWFRAGVVNVAAQDRPAAFETATPAYMLLNLYAGTELKWNGNPFTLSFFCTNLTDATYVDHLSRFKYFNLYDIGRNVGISLQLTF